MEPIRQRMLFPTWRAINGGSINEHGIRQDAGKEFSRKHLHTVIRRSDKVLCLSVGRKKNAQPFLGVHFFDFSDGRSDVVVIGDDHRCIVFILNRSGQQFNGDIHIGLFFFMPDDGPATTPAFPVALLEFAEH